MSNKVYDALKRYCLPILIAMGPLVLTVGEAWNIPHYKEIAITVGALATFLTTILNEASKSYFQNKQIVSVPEEYNGHIGG